MKNLEQCGRNSDIEDKGDPAVSCFGLERLRFKVTEYIYKSHYKEILYKGLDDYKI